ncbi:MAG: hypothetical protein ACUVSX_12630, partial [Aggregatilineales bacterium]
IQQALVIAEEVQDPAMHNYMGGYLAQAYLYAGDAAQALAVARKARSYDAPKNNHAVALWHGLAAFAAQQHEEAAAALHDALRYADELLAKTPSYYEARYTRALAGAGLVCLGDTDRLQGVRAAYAQAQAACSAAGVVQEARRHLQWLIARAGDAGKVLAGVI